MRRILAFVDHCEGLWSREEPLRHTPRIGADTYLMLMSEDPTPPQDKSDALDGVAVHLKRARFEKGLSVRELHEKTGISQAVLYGYEGGKTKPGARELTLICQALRVSPNVLLFGSEDPFGTAVSPAEKLMRLSNEPFLANFIGRMIVEPLFKSLGADQKKAWLGISFALLQATKPQALDLMVSFIDELNASVVDQLGSFAEAAGTSVEEEMVIIVMSCLERAMTEPQRGDSTKQ